MLESIASFRILKLNGYGSGNQQQFLVFWSYTKLLLDGLTQFCGKSIEVQTQTVDVEEYEIEPRCIELRPDTKLNVRKFKNVQQLEENQIKELEEFFSISDLSRSAYLNGEADIIVSGIALGDLLVGKFVDGQIIQWWAYELKKDHPEILYINIAASPMLIRQSVKQVKVMVDDQVQKHFDFCTKIFFPIHDNSHFTLLEFIKEGRRWIHYDSMKPRTDGNHQKAARKMRVYVSTLLKKLEKTKHQTSEKLQFADCPQQDSDSVDCELFVINVMKQRSDGIRIEKNDIIFTTDAMELQRAVLAHQILTSRPHGWTMGEHLTQKYLLSKANNTE